MFGHRDATAPLPVIELSVRKEGGGPEAKLSLSARHFLSVAANVTAPAVSTYAQDVQPGDVVTVMAEGRPSIGTVIAKRRALHQGAFNPYTTVRLLSTQPLCHSWTSLHRLAGYVRMCFWGPEASLRLVIVLWIWMCHNQITVDCQGPADRHLSTVWQCWHSRGTSMRRVHVLQGGNIVVDGVLASCHSDWFLDDPVQRLAPHLTPLLPAAYQVLLLNILPKCCRATCC